ncbi:hypothetical protein BDZ97DRAFT_2062601 [Flammula alnicola]|nr:hypothetical protein BDZ97DRAFT_2062601 [Flammula alnicola]
MPPYPTFYSTLLDLKSTTLILRTRMLILLTDGLIIQKLTENLLYNRPSTYITKHLEAAAPTNQLQQDILEFVRHPEYFIGLPTGWEVVEAMSTFLSAIKILGFGDKDRACNHQLKLITRMAKEEYPDDYRFLGREHDISKILVEIEAEQEIHEQRSREQQQQACEQQPQALELDECKAKEGVSNSEPNFNKRRLFRWLSIGLKTSLIGRQK